MRELDALCGPTGSLRQEPPDRDEYEGLIQAGNDQFADAQRAANSLHSRFVHASGAAHKFALAALRRAGYRPSQRYVVFQSLQHTLGMRPEVWRVLDHAHRARNLSEYEGDRSVDERLVEGLIEATRKVSEALRALPPL